MKASLLAEIAWSSPLAGWLILVAFFALGAVFGFLNGRKW